MKRVLVAIIIAVVLTFTGCDALKVLGEVIDILVEASEETEKAQQTVEATQVKEVQDSATSKETTPTLPELDFSETDFFEDGYEQVTYIRTTDGDTASFMMGGVNVKCRFVGINTPEVAHNGEPAEAFGEDSKSYTKKALESANTIVLERDDSAGTYDKYDRLLEWVWVDGELLALKLIENGLANTKYLRNNYKYADFIFEAEGKAKDNKIGIWE